jgi:hypothetical protein
VKTIHVLVEGQTEERFVKEVLQQHLLDLDLWITPIVLRNSGDGQPVRKGGVSSWSKMHRDLRHLGQDTSIVAITTLLDYYALPADVPGMSTRPGHLKPRGQVAHVEAATQHGPACANDLGLPLIRSRCPHFDEWLTWLETR